MLKKIKRGIFAILGVSLISLITGCASLNPKIPEKNKPIIGPYIQNVQQNQATVCWIGSGNHEFSLNSNGDGNGKTKTQGLEIKVRNHLVNQVKLQELEPGKTYEYSVGNRKRKFTTPTIENKDFNFVVYSDTQKNNEKHREILKQIIKFNPSFIVHAGDCVENGWNFNQWKQFLKDIEIISGQIPYYISIGNHEMDASEYFKLFALPGNERYYELKYSNLQFLFIDSNQLTGIPSLFNLSHKQLKFIENNIEKDKINIAVFHHAPHGGAKSKKLERKMLRNNLKNKLEGIEIVFSGHEHNYQRHVNSNTTYVVTGGGGADIYGVHPKDTLVKYAHRHHFVNVAVKTQNNKSILECSVIGDTGDLLDFFEVENQK